MLWNLIPATAENITSCCKVIYTRTYRLWAHTALISKHLILVHLSSSLFVMINHTNSCTSVLNMQQQAVTDVCRSLQSQQERGHFIHLTSVVQQHKTTWTNFSEYTLNSHASQVCQCYLNTVHPASCCHITVDRYSIKNYSGISPANS